MAQHKLVIAEKPSVAQNLAEETTQLSYTHTIKSKI